MLKKIVFPAWLAACLLAQAIPAQDKDFNLLNEYSMLSSRIEKARTAFTKGNLEKCEQEALYCLKKLADHHEAHYLLTQVLYKRGEFEKALGHIQAAEEGHLKMTEAAFSLEQRRKEEQMDLVGILIENAQVAEAAEKSATQRGSCGVNRFSKATQEAKEKLSKEESLDDTGRSQAYAQIPVNYFYSHGNCLFRLKRLPEAEAQYLRAIDTNPRYGEAYNNLINLLYMEKRLDEARVFAVKAEANQAAINPGLKKAVLEKAGK